VKIHRDKSDYFHGGAVQDGWTESPLSDRLARSVRENRIAAQDLQIFDDAFTRDSRAQFYGAFSVRLAGKIRIDRLDAVD
jgi:hypothetical protein